LQRTIGYVANEVGALGQQGDRVNGRRRWTTHLDTRSVGRVPLTNGSIVAA